MSTCSETRAISRPLSGPYSERFVVSEFPLNSWESIRAELIQRGGKSIVSISRWKTTPAGPQRTGVDFEFAAHRTADIAKLVGDVQRALLSLVEGTQL